MGEKQCEEIDKNSASFFHLIDLVKERSRTVREIASAIQYFFEDPKLYDKKGIDKYFKIPECSKLLSGVSAIIDPIDDFTTGNLESKLRSFAGDRGIDTAQIIHPLRLALTGKIASPGIFEIMQILGKMKVSRRIKRAIDFIQNDLN